MTADVERATRASRVQSGGGAWVRQTRAFARRYARELFRSRMVLFWSVGFPVGFYLLTIAVFLRGQGVPAEFMPYVKASTAVSYGMFGAVVASLNSFGQQLATDFEDGRYRQFRALPLAPSADLAGRLLAGGVLSLVSLAVVLVVAVPTGARFGLRSAAAVPVALLAVASFAVFWMVLAVVVSTAVRDTRYASVVTVSVALLSYFLTGYNGTDPASFQGPDVLLNWLPNTLATRLLAHGVVVPPDGSSVVTPPAVPDALTGLGVLAVYAAVSLAVALVVMRRFVYRTEVVA
jgi:ABC-2 type transport system permease protein